MIYAISTLLVIAVVAALYYRRMYKECESIAHAEYSAWCGDKVTK